MLKRRMLDKEEEKERKVRMAEISRRNKENDLSLSIPMRLLDLFLPTPTGPRRNHVLCMPMYRHPGLLWMRHSRLRKRSSAIIPEVETL
jgi:hypothetical protein